MPTVYIASCLHRHPDVFFSLSLALEDADISLVEVPSSNLWIRDWMPQKVPSGNFVNFLPKADTVKWPFLKVPEICWLPVCAPDKGELIDSDIILDGGNVVRSPDGKRVIMTCQTLANNGCRPIELAFGGVCYENGKNLKDKLEKLLEAQIIWIPVEPGDDLGHSDGEVAWIDDKTVFVNDFRSWRDPELSAYQKSLCKTLRSAGIETVLMPNAGDEAREIDEARFRKEHPYGDAWEDGTGFYLNFLKVGSLVLYPKFNIDRDERCVDALLDAWPDAKCVGIDCGYLAEEGGLLHCISWETFP